MAATTTLFFANISPHGHRVPVQNLSSIGSNKLWQPSSAAAQSTTTLTKPPVLLLRASSSSTVEKKDEEEEEESSISTPSDGLTDQSEPIASIPLGGCKACGKAEIERGCNGEGRIQGGIATVPGFGWWPIKAYRPCPGFVATGGRYRRQGQSMDEVAGFGNVPRISSKTATTTTAAGETQSSKKKGGPRKFKR